MRAPRPVSVCRGLILLAPAVLASATAAAGARNPNELTVIDRSITPDQESTSTAAGSGTIRLTVIDRSITQDQGDWQVDYRLRPDGAIGLVVTSGAVFA